MTTMSYETIVTDSGPFTVPVPNKTVDGKGFYISYNDQDISIYGSDTTALVVGQMEKFYILKGDHRGQYQRLIAEGFDACLAYFKANSKDAHNFSDKLPA